MVQIVYHRIRMNLLVGCPWRNGWSPQSVSGVQKVGALQQNLGQLKPLKSWHSIVTRNQVIHTTFDLKYGLFFCPATLLSQLWFVDFTPISGESTPVFVFDREEKPNTPNCFIQDLSVWSTTDPVVLEKHLVYRVQSSCYLSKAKLPPDQQRKVCFVMHSQGPRKVLEVHPSIYLY